MRVHPVTVAIMQVLICIVIMVILFNIKMVKVSDSMVPEVVWVTDDQREDIVQDNIGMCE